MSSIQPPKSKNNYSKVIGMFQVMPTEEEIEAAIAFLGIRYLNDPAQVAFLAMLFQLVPNYEITKSKTFNQQILDWHVRQLKFIFHAAKIKVPRWAGIRSTLRALQYRYPNSLLWNRAGQMYLTFLASQRATAVQS